MNTLNQELDQAITATSAELMALNFSVFIGTEGAQERRAVVLDRLTTLIVSKMQLESKDLMTPNYVGDPNPAWDDYGVGWDDSPYPSIEEVEGEF